MVIAVAAKDARDANEALMLAQATLTDVGTSEAYHQLVRDCRIRLQQPGNSVQFRVSGEPHGVEYVDQVPVGFPRLFDLEFLYRNLMGEETRLAGEIRIGP